MFHTFRFRLVALSVLVSAAALLAFAWLAWTLITRDQQKSFDADLSAQAARFAPRLAEMALRPAPGGENPDAALFLEQAGDAAPLYAVVAGGGETLLQSNAWPAVLSVDDFSSYALPPDDNVFPGPSPNGPPGARGGFGGPGGPGGRGRPPAPLTQVGQTTLLSRPEPNPRWRLAVVPAAGGAVVLGRSLAGLDEEGARVRDTFLIALPAALALIGAGAALLAGRAVAPLRKLSGAAQRLTAEGLHERIPRGGEDAEFAQLIDVFNRMLDRLERSFDQARRFSHDAAHELNTPLTVLMGQIDQALHHAPTGSPEQQRWAVLGEEVQRLRDIVRKLLLLAKADRGALRPEFQDCDLVKLVRDCLDGLAAASGLAFSLEGDETLPLAGDPALLRQVLLNLLSNAVKYNRPGGAVRVRCAREMRDGRAWVGLAVTNTGPALPPEQAAHVFDRFFRGDAARNRTSGGLGLGLSLAREFARAHGGDLELAENAEDAITFRLDLPAAQAGETGPQT